MLLKSEAGLAESCVARPKMAPATGAAVAKEGPVPLCQFVLKAHQGKAVRSGPLVALRRCEAPSVKLDWSLLLAAIARLQSLTKQRPWIFDFGDRSNPMA